MATFRQYETRKGEFWEVRGYLGTDEATGKEHTITKRGFETKKEAQHYFQNAVLQFRNSPSHVPRGANHNLTVNELYQEWLEVYSLDVKESTLNKTKRQFKNHILNEFGEYRITKLTHRPIQKWINKLSSELVHYKNVFNDLKRLLDYAFKQGYIKENPCHRVSVPKKSNKPREEKKTKTFYTKEELKTFLKALEGMETKKWLAYFRLLAFTGIRRGEGLALQWRDINHKDKLLTVNKTVTLGENNKQYVSSTKTEAGNRVISIDQGTLDTLKEWKREQAETLLSFGYNALDPEQYVFSKLKDNEPLNVTAPRNALVKICERFDLPMINIHGFRHTHCSLLFEAGVPMKDVKERLGHSDIQTTMNIYTHVTESSRSKSAELFANYVNF